MKNNIFNQKWFGGLASTIWVTNPCICAPAPPPPEKKMFEILWKLPSQVFKSIYSGTLNLRYGKGQQNNIVKSGYRCKQTPNLTI